MKKTKNETFKDTTPSQLQSNCTPLSLNNEEKLANESQIALPEETSPGIFAQTVSNGK